MKLADKIRHVAANPSQVGRRAPRKRPRKPAILAAEALSRLVERPSIALGHRLAERLHTRS
jgi:hypothetical protein